MTCPRPDGTYAPWCTNIPSTTTSSSTSSTTTTTWPVTTTSIPRVTTTTAPPVVVTTSTTTVVPPPPELPRTGSGDFLIGLVVIAALMVAIGLYLVRRARNA